MSETIVSSIYPCKLSMTNEEYHAHEAVGSSSLKEMLRSPLHYFTKLTNPRPPTPSQSFGTAVHYALLEPVIFKKRVVVAPKFSGTGARATRDRFLTANHGNIIVSEGDMEAIKGIVYAAANHPFVSKLIAAGVSEESYFWIDSKTGLLCKCRPDYFRVGSVIVDIKTTQDASFKEFQRTIAKYHYDLSAAHYVEGCQTTTNLPVTAFIFVAIEQEPPYGIACYHLDDGSLEAGNFKRRLALDRLSKCKQNNKFPGYSEDLVPISLPAWAFPFEGEGQ